MIDIGAQLRQNREARGVSLEVVARDTNISKSYLASLEENNFDQFPAESYMIGFLRTYAEYLGLSSQDLIAAYRNFRIQEAPPPLEALIVRKPSLPPWTGLALVVLIAVAGLTALGIWAGPGALAWIADVDWSLPQAAEPVRESRSLSLAEDRLMLEERLYQGDTVSLTVDGQPHALTVAQLGDALTLSGLPGQTNTLRLRLGEGPAFVDFSGNGVPDISLLLQDIALNDPAKGVLLTIERVERQTELLAGTALEPLGQEAPAPAPASPVPVANPAAGRASQVITEADQPAPFRVDVVFRGNSFFRNQVDALNREEGYFQKSDQVRLDVTNRVALWVGNAGSILARTQGVDLTLGRSGEVVAWILHWVRNSSTGRWQLRLDPFS